MAGTVDWAGVRSEAQDAEQEPAPNTGWDRLLETLEHQRRRGCFTRRNIIAAANACSRASFVRRCVKRAWTSSSPYDVLAFDEASDAGIVACPDDRLFLPQPHSFLAGSAAARGMRPIGGGPHWYGATFSVCHRPLYRLNYSAGVAVAQEQSVRS